ncbi:glycosyltransferase family 39 protein [bacterium]|nr:glycosyltransferase family 39 protein [bacterium]
MRTPQSNNPLSAGNGPLYLSLPSLGLTGTLLGLFLLTAYHFWLAATLPPSPDELYYWAWAQKLQPSYFDHPPMVAYAIRFSTALFGNSLTALRLPAIGMSLVVFLVLLAIANRGILAWLVFLTPLSLYGSVLITPDLPLAFFWMLYALWLGRINATLDGWSHDPVTRVYRASPVAWSQWILGGAILGFGGLSKYTMVLAVPCALVVFATRTRLRAWGPGFLLHLLIAGLLVAPVLGHFWRLDFAPLHFQWNHAMKADGFSLSQSFEFLSGQALLIGLLPLLLLPWVLMRGRDLCADPRSQVYFWFFVLPMVFFLYRSFRLKLEGNWAIVAYLTFWPVADRLLSWSSFRTLVRGLVFLGFAVPLLLSALIFVHLIHPIERIPPKSDRFGVLRGQWDVAHSVAERFRQSPPAGPLWVSDYQWTSYLRYLGLPAQQIFPGSRPSQFTPPDQDPCAQTDLTAVQTNDLHPEILSCFPVQKILDAIPVYSRQTKVGHIWLVQYAKQN